VSVYISTLERSLGLETLFIHTQRGKEARRGLERKLGEG